MQSIDELKTRAEAVELSSFSTNQDQCDNCRFFRPLTEGIGYCIHKDVDMVVGGPWWCKLWAPAAATGKAGEGRPSRVA